MIGGEIFAAEFFADAVEEGVEFGEEGLWRKAAPLGVPHPLVSHGADAALYLCGIGDAGECGGNHVAVFEGGGEAVAFGWVVTEPVEELCEAPLVGVDVAAPVDGLEVFGEGELGDLAGFFVGAVIAPEVVVVDGLEVRVDGDDAGAGGVECDGGDVPAVDLVLFEDATRGFDERAHLVGVGLGGVVGVVALTGEGIVGGGCAEASADAVEERYTNAEGSEVDSCNGCHEVASLKLQSHHLILAGI